MPERYDKPDTLSGLREEAAGIIGAVAYGRSGGPAIAKVAKIIERAYALGSDSAPRGTGTGRERSMAAIRYLAALDDRYLREALLVFRHEQPDKARRLLDLLTGAAEPAWKSRG